MIRFFMFVTALTFLPMVAVAEGFTDEQRAEIKEIVKEAIMENPQTMIDSIEAYRIAQEEEAQAEQDEKIAAYIKNLPKELDAYSVGNPDGDVHIIEFFDYNCGYCKKAFEEVMKILEDDKQVYVTFIEMPILGPSSQEASQWGVVAARQGKYFEYHQAAMNFNGQLNSEELEKIAKKAGLDVKKGKKEKDMIDVAEFLEDNKEKAASIGFTGTPGFLINTMPVRGYLDYERMQEAIASVREKDKADE